MTDTLSNAQIAILGEFGERDLSNLTGDKKRDLEWLISAGYAEPAKQPPGSAFKLTAKGAAFLAERGVGLNEA
jgi:hypothetical protein